MKPLYFEGSFYRMKEKKSVGVRTGEWIRWLISATACLSRNGIHYQCKIGRGIVVQQGQTTHCWKLWPHAGNALQQSFHNFNLENIIDSLPFMQTFFMNHLVCQKNVISMILFLDFCERHFLGLGDDFEVHCIPWSFISESYWNTHDSVAVAME